MVRLVLKIHTITLDNCNMSVGTVSSIHNFSSQESKKYTKIFIIIFNYENYSTNELDLKPELPL